MRYSMIFSLFAFMCSYMLHAQENTVAGGAEGTGIGGSASFTIGQIDYVNATGTNGNINQGVQQPLEFFTMGEDASPQIQLKASTYPNPTQDICWLLIEEEITGDLHFQLNNMEGKLLQSQLITQHKTEVNMMNLASGTYFLQILNNKQHIKTFKIIKP